MDKEIIYIVTGEFENYTQIIYSSQNENNAVEVIHNLYKLWNCYICLCKFINLDFNFNKIGNKFKLLKFENGEIKDMTYVDG